MMDRINPNVDPTLAQRMVNVASAGASTIKSQQELKHSEPQDQFLPQDSQSSEDVAAQILQSAAAAAKLKEMWKKSRETDNEELEKSLNREWEKFIRKKAQEILGDHFSEEKLVEIQELLAGKTQATSTSHIKLEMEDCQGILPIEDSNNQPLLAEQ